MTDTTWPPPWTLKPVYGEPNLVQEYDENDKPLPDFIHWAIAFGFAINVGHLDGECDATSLTFSAHFSDDDLARGFVKRQVSAEQLERFALLLMAKAARYRQEAAR
jgi:hypothetical protein